MIRLEFLNPLTASDIRESVLTVCHSVVLKNDLLNISFQEADLLIAANYAKLTKLQKRRMYRGADQRDWVIDYLQSEGTSKPESKSLGAIILRGPFKPKREQFGGFTLPLQGYEPTTYSHVNVHTPSELGHQQPSDLISPLRDLTYNALIQHFKDQWPESSDNPKLET